MVYPVLVPFSQEYGMSEVLAKKVPPSRQVQSHYITTTPSTTATTPNKESHI